MKLLLVLSGSKSNSPVEDLIKLILFSGGIEELKLSITDFLTNNKISNNELAGIFVAFGFSQSGGEVDFLCLKQMTDFDYEKIKSFDSIVFSTPLHFGNPSSILLKFLKNINDFNGKLLKNKMVGQVSVGARRNGGQEMANIFGLFEYSKLGAIVVGDGPPYSQSGGSVEARSVFSVLEDKDGLDSCINLGKRINYAASLLSFEKDEFINLLVVSDYSNNDELVRHVKDGYHGVNNIDSINLKDFIINNCTGCDICPDFSEKYGCVISDDFMKIDQVLRSADGVIVDLNPNSPLWSSYYWQTFIERTRYLRRDNYTFANIPIAGFKSNTNSSSEDLYIRVVPPAFKHDMLFLGIIASDEDLNNFIDIVHRIKNGRKNMPYSKLYKEEAKRFI